jgi:hypothetical protein
LESSEEPVAVKKAKVKLASAGVSIDKISAETLTEHLDQKDFANLFSGMRNHMMQHNPEVFKE